MCSPSVLIVHPSRDNHLLVQLLLRILYFLVCLWLGFPCMLVLDVGCRCAVVPPLGHREFCHVFGTESPPPLAMRCKIGLFPIASHYSRSKNPCLVRAMELWIPPMVSC